MSFWSDLSKTVNAPNWWEKFTQYDQNEDSPTYGQRIAYDPFSSIRESDGVNMSTAGDPGIYKNLPTMDITDYNYAGPNTAKVNGQPITYGALGTGFGEYAPNPAGGPNPGQLTEPMFASGSSQRDAFSSRGYGIDPSGQYVVMSKPTMTPPPKDDPSIGSATFNPFIEGSPANFAMRAAGMYGGVNALANFAGPALSGITNTMPPASLPASGYSAAVPAGMSAGEQIATGERFASLPSGTSTDVPSFDAAPDYANAGYDVPNEAYRQPFDLEYGDGMGGPASAAMQAAGAVSPVTPGLIAQLAAYTGLSTGAIERLGGAAISSLAGLYGANVVGNAADRAANRLAESNQASTQLQKKIYEDQVARQQPFYQAGVNALPAYTKGVMPGGDLVRPFSMDDYQADPGYGFRLSEGMKAIDRSAASRGRLLSGETIKDAQRFGQGLATQEYQNAYNRFGSDQATRRNALAGLAGGFAPTAAQQLNASGVNYAANVNDLGASTARNYGNADLTGAAARQSAYGGAGGAFANALNPNPYNAFLNRQMGVIG